VTVRIPKRHATQVLHWLHENVASNVPRNMSIDEQSDESYLNPNYVSTTAQVAIWKGHDDHWRIRQHGHSRFITVDCRDPKIESWIGLRWQ